MIPQIIELIYYMLASNDIRVLIFGLLKDYFKNQELKTTLQNENVNEEELDQPYSLFNPNILKKLLNIITPDEIKNIRSIINKVSKFAEKGTNKEDKESLNKDNSLGQDNQGWTILSSSWFKKGLFTKTSKTLKSGLLTSLFQSDTSKNKRWYGPYTYPSFPEEIWLLMTQQRGKNGAGAGSIFWKYWLRSWLPSKLRSYVKKNLKDTLGITKGRQSYYILQAKNINVSKTTSFINRLERGFFRLKTYKTLPKTEVGSKAYREVRKEMFIKNNKFYSTYKNKNTYQKYGRNK